MPINRKWPIEAVMDAVRRSSFAPASASRLNTSCWAASPTGPSTRERWRGWSANRTACQGEFHRVNPGPGIAYRCPNLRLWRRFANSGWQGIPAYLRKPRGRDIYAACGQLKRTVEG